MAELEIEWLDGVYWFRGYGYERIDDATACARRLRRQDLLDIAMRQAIPEVEPSR